MTTAIDSIPGIVDAARAAYRSGQTKPVAARLATLAKIRAQLLANEEVLLAALAADFGKPRLEAWVTEIGFCLSDLDFTEAHLASWMHAERVPTPLLSQPGSSHLVREPKGVVCVIAPWNYPVQLLLLPVIAAVAAGNAVIAKPSELTPHTDAVLAKMFSSLNDPAVTSVHGGVAETTALLAERFDHIIYTGNGRVARVVMRAAAENLTPVTLELGGKSPAIVSRHADIDVAARRIAWGKFLNAGQTCIAPDYVVVERPVHDELVKKLSDAITEFYGADPQTSPDLARIVSEPHFHRLEKLLHNGTVAAGGQTDVDTRYIAPTILTGITRDDPVMGEEIFGPILPIIAVDDLAAAADLVNADDKPLALYVFTDRTEESDRMLAEVTSGGACVNGTIMHVSNPHLPFGGVGQSGMGAYHGRAGFDTFSHVRSVYSRSTRIDPPMLYPPYSAKKEKLIRKGLLMSDPRDTAAKLANRLRRTR